MHSVTCNRCNESGFKWVRGQYGKFHLEDANGNPHRCGSKRQFLANQDATCPSCGGEIKANITPVTWARRGANKGILYHENCAAVAPVEAETQTPATKSVTKIEESENTPMSDNLAAMLAASIQPHLKLQAEELSSNLLAQVDEKVNSALAQLKPQVHTIVMKESGEILAKIETKQHALFPLLMQMVALRQPVYCWGDAGSGKSMAARIISDALGLPFYYLALQAQTTESKLMGYMDANGHYVETDFYRAYVNGGVFLLDELELGNGNLLGSLNGALANGSASFPNGLQHRHADFVCIATGNTPALGATPAYSDRRALDGSVRDRFAFIEWNTDEDFESSLAESEFAHGAKWARYVQSVRRSAKSISPRLIVTQRASVAGAKLLANGVKPQQVADMLIFRGFETSSVKSLLSANPIPTF